jgi:hypothetical protein
LGIHYEPRDLWVGVFYTRTNTTWYMDATEREWTFYVCLVPCLPFLVRVSHVRHAR